MGINNSQRCRRQICVQGGGTLENTGMIFKFTPTPGGETVEVGLYPILGFSFFFLVPFGIIRVPFVKITEPHLINIHVYEFSLKSDISVHVLARKVLNWHIL